MADQSNGNGHKGMLSTLSGETRVKTYERLEFYPKSLEEVIQHIRSLGHSGSLTVNFQRGNISGTARFEREVKDGK